MKYGVDGMDTVLLLLLLVGTWGLVRILKKNVIAGVGSKGSRPMQTEKGYGQNSTFPVFFLSITEGGV